MIGNYEALLDQIEIWHENENQNEIINAISKIPETERSYELICLLARAYNNTNDYEKALNLLLSVEKEGTYDPIWHYRIGYAYYYLNMPEQAEKSFERVLESDSGNEDARKFLDRVREEINESEKIKPRQDNASLAEMVKWLSHESELGHLPAEIELAGEFDFHDLHYYIYKYKKSSGGPWLLGVAGGYGRRNLNHCGHVFSGMEEYFSETAEEKAIALVEMLREAQMKESEELELGDLNPDQFSENWLDQLSPFLPDELFQSGPFVGFVLLNSDNFDGEQIKAHLKNDWNILFQDDDSLDNPDISAKGSLIFESDGMLASASLIKMPVPKGEAEYFAETNYMWPNAVSETKTHVAQILVTVSSYGHTAIETAKLFTKVVTCCLKLGNAVGVYTSGTVFQPAYYIEMADLMKEEDLPIYNWIYFGVYTSENGASGYTYGLSLFGKSDIEIIDSAEKPESVYDFLADISYYILKEDVDLKDGETIGFTEFQKLKITKSKGVERDGDTFKIDY